MGISGQWVRSRRVELPYADARRWGTGINPVHAVRDNTGRGNEQSPGTIPAAGAVPEYVNQSAPWGYEPDDIAGLDVFSSPVEATHGIQFMQDDLPRWGQSTTETRASIQRDMRRPWGAGPRFKAAIHSFRAGARDRDQEFSNETPTETVNEGFINKPSSGMGEGEVPDAVPSSDGQLIVQTSMVQRNKSMDNGRAQLRDTDDPRTSIASRIVPMRLRIYSEGQRLYDMLPRDQNQSPRPFSWRTAGTGPAEWMQPNSQYPLETLQRTPPPDPSMGTPDTQYSDGYGYSDEDSGWY
jgi:hypothetical protein